MGAKRGPRPAPSISRLRSAPTRSHGGDSHGNRRLHSLSSGGPDLWNGLGRTLLQNDYVVFDAPRTANLALDVDVSL
jgi:hypothetical protein